MTRPQRIADFGVWHVPGATPRILYSKPALHDIAVDVFEAYQMFPPSGYEIGGVLFGQVTPDGIRILTSRQIQCEHRNGPEFALSTGDETWLEQFLTQYTRDEGLEGLVPLGWYRARNRDGIALTDADVALWKKFFPHPHQVALVLRPLDEKPVQGGFFFRPAEGEPRIDSSHLLFDASLTVPIDVQPPSQAAQNLAADALKPPDELFTAFTPPVQRYPWVLPAVALLVIGAIAATVFLWRRPIVTRAGADPEFGLFLVERDGTLRLEWDTAAAPIAQTERATLEVTDGGIKRAITLGPANLRAGSLLLSRSSSDVAVALALERPERQPLVSVARFVSAHPYTPPAPAEPDLDLVELRKKAADLTRQLEQRRERNQKLAAAKQPEPPKKEPPKPEPIKPAPVEPAPAPAAPPAYTGPKSGKLIWTGPLGPGDMLKLENGRAPSGTLTGSLPGVPVRLTVYPAEFSAGGLTVYSGAARHSRGDVTEPRSAQNGWLNTRYIYDPDRAQNVTLAEQPSDSNNFRSLTLRGGSRPERAVVIEWQVAN